MEEGEDCEGEEGDCRAIQVSVPSFFPGGIYWILFLL